MHLGQPLNLDRLTWPTWRQSLFCVKGLLLGGVLPVWLALGLAVPSVEETAALRPAIKPAAVVSPGGGKATSGAREHAPLPVEGVRLAALHEIFDERGYTLAAVASGETGVPPIFVRTLPPDWREQKAAARKQAFVKTLLPLILQENARIRAERARLLQLIQAATGDPASLPDTAQRELRAIAKRYRTGPGDVETLKLRVDEIPVSLALAQAAHESAWGTSRFARQGNALFGQWTWNPEEGIRPKNPQKDKGSYAVRKFDTLGGSVAAYMNNLNTHSAYRDLRLQRARLRAAGKPLDGIALAAGLLRYSQRGEDYIHDIRRTIRRNSFQRFDGARLIPTRLG